MLNDFTPTGVSQLNLFDDTQPRNNSNQLMKVVDGITFRTGKSVVCGTRHRT
ncbi:protein samB [Enterobacter sp. BIDMC 29]|nr:protein samB [Enterobacter sp. BIDMC 29]